MITDAHDEAVEAAIRDALVEVLDVAGFPQSRFAELKRDVEPLFRAFEKAYLRHMPTTETEWQPAETRKRIDGERFLAGTWGGNEDDIKILQWSDAFGDFRGEEGMPEYFECWRPMVALPPARPPGSKP